MYPDDLNPESFATGMVVGANKGYQRGLAEGQAQGEAAGYSKGYDAGKADGEAAGYDKGYETGKVTGEAEGYSKGHDDGYAQGQTDGEATGYTKGYEAGYAQGKIDGDSEGYERGYNEGLALADEEYQKGYQDGYKAGQAASGGGDGETLQPAEDGATELYIDIVADALRAMQLCFCQTVENGVTIDWGDGVVETIDGTDAVTPAHTYDTTGEYVIRLLPSDGCELTFGAGGTTGRNIFNDSPSPASGLGVVLRKAILGKNVETIGSSAFRNCWNLESVYIQNGVKALGQYCFYTCSSLRQVSLPDTLMDMSKGYEFNSCYSLKEIEVPAGVSTIGLSTFGGCYSLKKLSLGKITTTSGTSFSACRGLQRIDFPDTLKTLNYNCMSGAINLREIHMKGSKPPTLSRALSVGYSDYKVYIPKGSLGIYSVATYWKDIVDRFIEE